MSATMNTRIKLKRDTTEHWNNAQGFIPLQGEVIVYTDHEKTIRVIGNKEVEVDVPGIKIGTGNSYIQDLPFVDDELRNKLMVHIDDMDMHTTLQEKLFWNNKVNIDDEYEIMQEELEDETLIFNRN